MINISGILKNGYVTNSNSMVAIVVNEGVEHKCYISLIRTPTLFSQILESKFGEPISLQGKLTKDQKTGESKYIIYNPE